MTWIDDALDRLAQRAPAGDQRLRRAVGRVGGDEQAAAGRRRERRGDLQLGIVLAAGALIGVGPGVVEDVFALAVRLEVGRRGGDEPAVGVLDDHMGRRPAGSPADRPEFLQRAQERVGDERVEALAGAALGGQAGRVGAGVPRLGGDFAEAGDGADGQSCGHALCLAGGGALGARAAS